MKSFVRGEAGRKGEVLGFGSASYPSGMASRPGRNTELLPSLVCPYQSPFGQDMALHRPHQVLCRCLG